MSMTIHVGTHHVRGLFNQRLGWITLMTVVYKYMGLGYPWEQRAGIATVLVNGCFMGNGYLALGEYGA